MNYLKYILIAYCFSVSSLWAQDEPVQIEELQADTLVTTSIDPLRPAKAAFYSAVIPGLGQAYNKSYWKIPIVYAAIGTSIYFYQDNNKKYERYRDAYKSRLAGNTNDEFQYLDDNRLITAQRFYKKNREYSLMFALGFYVLNIVEANIDAHLKQFNVNDNLSIAPDILQNEMNNRPQMGLTLQYKF